MLDKDGPVVRNVNVPALNVSTCVCVCVCVNLYKTSGVSDLLFCAHVRLVQLLCFEMHIVCLVVNRWHTHYVEQISRDELCFI